MFWKRLKNIWALGAYKVNVSPELLDERFKTLTKDFPTVKKKLATIIQEPVDFFKNEESTDK